MSNSSPKNGLISLVSNILLLAGLPATSFIAIWTQTKNIWWSIVISALCEVVALFIKILVQIATKVGDHVANNATESILVRLKQLRSNPQKKYREYLSNSMKDLDMKGLTIESSFTLSLEDVFVDLSVFPTSPSRASANPVKLPKNLSEGKSAIWDYLSPHSNEKRHFVILGPPGSGKTTLLRHVALTLVQSDVKQFLLDAFIHKKLSKTPSFKYRIPIVLYLREHTRLFEENPETSLLEMIRNDLKRKWIQVIPLEWIEHKLEKGHCIILLDGLDEVADSTLRHRVVDWVQGQMVAYPQNHFLITSRPYGYTSYPLSGVTVLGVQPFTKEKIKQFVERWYLANETSNAQKNKKDFALIKKAASAGAKDLLQRMINKPALFDLAVNPLLLTMITTVHRYRNNSLPGKRIGLYSEICEVFLGRRQEMRGIILELDSAEKRQVLQKLAFEMISAGKREILLSDAEAVIEDTLSQIDPAMRPQKFLQLVENSSGLLLEHENEIYTFAHLTFQEYLASTYIKEEQMEQLLIENINTSWWHETIRLYCAQTDASNIITACIESQQPSMATLILALECVNEALRIQLSVKKQLDAFINQSIEHSNSDQRHLIADTFLAQRTQQMAHLEKERYIDKTFVTCTEYQLFLDDQQQNNIYCSPDHWDSNSFPVNQGKSPVMGIRPSDAKMFCQWLTKRSSSDIWQYRLPTTDDLKKLTDDEGIQRILDIGKEATYWIDDGQKAAANEVPSYTSTIKQHYFDPRNLDAIVPSLKCILMLPRKCATTFSPSDARHFVTTLYPIIQLARIFAEESGVPGWTIAYYSSPSSESSFSSSLPPISKKLPQDVNKPSLNVAFPMSNPDSHYPNSKHEKNFIPDLPPNPATAFNQINDFLRDIISPNLYLKDFLNDVDTHMKQNGLILDPRLDRTLFHKSSSILKLIQVVKSIFTIVTKNIDQIKNNLNELNAFTDTSFYPKSSFDAYTVFLTARSQEPNYFKHINFPILETQLLGLANQLMAKKNTPAFDLHNSPARILHIINSFNLEDLLNTRVIIDISQALLDALDLSRQRAFNSLYIPENILPAGSTLTFLHLFLRVRTIRLFAYLRAFLKVMSILNKSSLLINPDKNYANKDYEKAKIVLSEAINQCISIYASSTIIGARYQNQLPVLEGIILIKEPREQEE